MELSRRRALWGNLAVAVAVALALGCGVRGGGTPGRPAPGPPAAAAPTYRATIRWTSHGVPHVTAGDLGSLAFGQGHAFATHHVCVLADQIVKLRGERAKLL